jgi:hypothetical protein
MMVAVGPIGRSFLGTSLPPQYQATGLALLAAQWVIGEAIGAGAGGLLIDHMPIRTVLYVAAVMPALSAVLVFLVFSGYQESGGRRATSRGPPSAKPAGLSLIRVMIITASIVLLLRIGAGGEPPRPRSPRTLASASLRTAMFIGHAGRAPWSPADGLDRWGRRATMIAERHISGGVGCVRGRRGVWGGRHRCRLGVVGASRSGRRRRPDLGVARAGATRWRWDCSGVRERRRDSAPPRRPARSLGRDSAVHHLCGGVLLAALVAAVSIGRRSIRPLSRTLEPLAAAQPEAQAPVEGDVRDPGQASSEPAG